MPESPVIPLTLVGLGGYLMWFGVHYWRDSQVRWPVDPIKAVLQGKPLPGHTESDKETAEETSILTFSGGGGSGGGTGGGGGGSGGGGGGSGGTYSDSQLQALWVMAGGSKSAAAGAACIATHESSGNPQATSSNPDGGTNVGLWQLDTPHGKGAGYTVEQLMNPLTNARVAIAGSSDGTNWSAWQTAPACGL